MNSEKLYSEVCSNIRQTDTISAALLGFVPVASGSALMVLLLKKNSVAPPVMVAVSLLGFLVTFGLYMWEKRNIDSCEKFRDVAIELERYCGDNLRPFSKIRDDKPTLFSIKATKTRAENIIYGAALVAWLVSLIYGAWTWYTLACT